MICLYIRKNFIIMEFRSASRTEKSKKIIRRRQGDEEEEGIKKNVESYPKWVINDAFYALMNEQFGYNFTRQF